jgi:ATP-binding cassette, subfamily C, bacterial CydD
MSDIDEAKAAARAWIRREQRAGRRPARPVIVLGLLGTILGISQAFCAASVLTGRSIAASLVGFAVAGLLRAVTGYAAERAGFAAGAGARRRLRTDIVTRLARARPLLSHARHSAELAALVVDRIEALDGLFARFIPAIALAIGAPVVVALVATAMDPLAGLILALTGLFVPMAMALSGLGATADPLPGSHPRHCHHCHARPRRGRGARPGPCRG